MQSILITSLLLISVINMEVVKIDASFITWCIYLKNGLFLVIVISHLIGITGGLLLFALNSIVSFHQGGVFFFLSHSRLLFLQLDLVDLLIQGGTKDFFLSIFDFLHLNSSSLDFLEVEP